MERIRERSDASLDSVIGAECLRWYPEMGLGYFPVKTGIQPYNADYFERYAKQADSDIGRRLMRARVDFVARHHGGPLCDIGIGAGAFVTLRNRHSMPTYGYDVNPAGLEWLEARGLFVDPHLVPQTALSFWDVLEHIHDFRSILAQAKKFVFVSLPIFRDANHVLVSKHYRRDEHCWYFTHDGFLAVMYSLGFRLVEHNKQESEIGREDIESFAFRRLENDFDGRSAL